YYIGHAAAALAECMLAGGEEGDRARALDLGLEVSKLGEQGPMPDIHARGLLITARAYAASGNLSSAREAIGRALQVGRSHPYVDEAEEVYLNHALLLRGADEEAAQASLPRAHALVEERANRLSDQNRRRSFLEAPPNRDIFAAWQKLRRS